MIRRKITEYLTSEFSDVYCESCKHRNDEDYCENCHCKSMGWGLSQDAAEEVTDKIIRIILRYEDEHAPAYVHKPAQ